MKKNKLIIILLAILMLTACSNSTNDSGVKGVVETFFSSFKSSDYEKAEEVSDGGEDFPVEDSEKELYTKMLKNLSWEIGEATENGNEATVKVVVKNKQIPMAFQNALAIAYNEKINKELSDDETSKIFIDSLPQAIEEAEDISQEIEVKLIKEDDKWILQRDLTLMTSLFGNVPQDTPEMPSTGE